ncbi:MAG: serpin family protein [Cyanosarcina radialis HA8281-LM2]|nr:serpin family protein [Cyanosarcina radialis HA8281-LM2]
MNRYWLKLAGISAVAATILLLYWLIPHLPKIASADRFTPETIATSPSTPSDVSSPTTAPQIGKVNEKLVAANTNFGFKLFSQIRQQEGKKNVFVSPTSIAIALSMTYNGAAGETQSDMAKALELQGISLAEVNRGNKEIKALLENPDSGIQLAIANSLWTKKEIAFKPEFIQQNQEFYRAKVTDLDFKDPNVKDIINNWVKESTKGKIDRIVEEIKPDDVLFLINAIHFKGNWARKFDSSQTANYPFYLLDGKSKQHPMMSQSGKYKYFENESFQAVSLPYDKERFSFYIFLPKKSTTLDAFSQQLTAQNWEAWMKKFRQREGSIRIPRFKLEYENELASTLKALGMRSAFEPGKANFSQMTAESVFISQVKHKTFVEVNEEGTEAAASTSVGISITSAPVEEPFNLVVDRPFFCAIRDDRTGTILFMGSIVEPN